MATRDLQSLRYPEKSAVAQPVTHGCYITVYWITAGRYADHMKWTVAINRRLNRDSRVHHDRTHVFTAFQDHPATVYRDGADGPRDFHALDHPYTGLAVEVVEVVDTDTPQRCETLLDLLRDRHLPRRLAGSPSAVVTVFRPTPLPLERMSCVKQVEGVGTRLTLLWFLQREPREVWEEHFTGLDAEVSGRGSAGSNSSRPTSPWCRGPTPTSTNCGDRASGWQ